MSQTAVLARPLGECREGQIPKCPKGYLGISPQYDEETQDSAEATVPYVVGMSKDEAAAKLADYGFSAYRVVGDGD